jgi:spore coat protein H
MNHEQRLIFTCLLSAILTAGLVACGSNNNSGTGDTSDGGGSDGDADADADTDTDTDTDHGLCSGDDVDFERPAGWTQESHCAGVVPAYDRLFAEDVVLRFDITVSAQNYEVTMADLATKLSGGGPGGPPGGGDDSGDDPMWVPVTIEYDGLTWTHVGMRYKGNSSLRSSWQQGIRKLAFRLNFEMYEADFPEIDDQRFFGFEKMTFSNGFKDSSLLRDRVAGDIFREGGVPAARGSFAQIYVDFGEGPTYFGLYTMIEDPSNKMLDTQFDDDDGNLYKPEDEGAKWDTYIEEHFDKKTNWEDPDWSDVKAAHTALHASRSDAAAWRTGLEAVFNVESFLKTLSISQTMQNWDSYGFMNHNYYIYGDPSDGGRISWFPWDLNESMLEGGKGGDTGSIMLDGIGEDWPLIRFLLDDTVYRARYKELVQAAVDGPFAVDKVFAKMDAYHELIAPYVVGPEATEKAPYTFLSNAAAFNNSLTTGNDALKPHVESRHEAVKNAL